MLVPELVSVMSVPGQNVPPPPAVMVGGATTVAKTGVLGVEVQLPRDAAT